jgi:hypothetical protein
MTTEFGARLRSAIERWGSIRRFQQVMERTGAPGCSEPAVYRYLRGVSEPGVTWLRHASGILEVSVHWLVTGEDHGPACTACAYREKVIADAVAILTEERTKAEPPCIGGA